MSDWELVPDRPRDNTREIAKAYGAGEQRQQILTMQETIRQLIEERDILSKKCANLQIANDRMQRGDSRVFSNNQLSLRVNQLEEMVRSQATVMDVNNRKHFKTLDLLTAAQAEIETLKAELARYKNGTQTDSPAALPGKADRAGIRPDDERVPRQNKRDRQRAWKNP